MPKVGTIGSVVHKFKVTVKVPHRNFHKAYLHETMNNLLYYTHLVMELSKKVNIPCGVEYKYNFRKVIDVIYTKFTV